MRKLLHFERFWKHAAIAVLTLGLSAGAGLMAQDDGASAASEYTEYVGGGGRGIAVESFFPTPIFVNQGDSIKFVNNYEELHTVTFTTDGKVPELIIPAGPPPKDGPPKLIFNPQAANPAPAPGPVSFDGSAYANSGLMFKGTSWNVSFTKQGQYTFFCILHPGMTAQVVVQAPGVYVPTQAQRDFEANQKLTAAINAGDAAAAAVTPGKTVTASGTNWQVLNAASAGQSDVMRFLPSRLDIAVGDSVTWSNNTPVPHTVTFLSGAPLPELVLPELKPNGPPDLVINPMALFPVKSSQNYDGAGYVNSGFIGNGPEATGGSSFSLTFTKAGTYTFLCILHADQGMAGVIQVSTASGIRPPATGDAGLVAPGNGSHATYFYGLALLVLVTGTTGAVAVRQRSR